MPVIIAHRGARREAPENTMPAFRRALELGAGGIELDTMLTADFVPVVTHNNDLSILTPHHGLVHRTPLSIIRTIDAGSHFNKEFSGTAIPTLAEVLDLLRGERILTIVEIKAQPWMIWTEAKLIGGMLSDFNPQGSLIVSSSNMRILHHLGQLYPKLSRALIIRLGDFSFFRSDIFGRIEKLQALHPCLIVATPDLVARAHARGSRVDIWTVNTKADIDRAIELGADGIITDDAAFALKHIERH